MARRNASKARATQGIGHVRAGERREWLRIAGVPDAEVRGKSKRDAGHLLSDLDI